MTTALILALIGAALIGVGFWLARRAWFTPRNSWDDPVWHRSGWSSAAAALIGLFFLLSAFVVAAAALVTESLRF